MPRGQRRGASEFGFIIARVFGHEVAMLTAERVSRKARRHEPFRDSARFPVRYPVAMKGCAISGLLQLLAWLGTGAGIILLLERRCGIPPSQSFAPALIIALLIVIAAGLLFGAARVLRERAQLSAAARGERPVDGRRSVIAGTIHAIGDPLTAPLSGKRCIAFRYDISQWFSGGKSGQRLAVLCDGVALCPSEVRTLSGSYKLLAVPALETAAESLDSSAKRRAAEHLAHATFTAAPEPFKRPELEKEWSDDDGAYRRERRYTTNEINLDDCVMTEQIIANGAAVAVFGRYSAARGGIVPDANWANATRIMTADPATAAKQLQQRAVRYVVFGATGAVAAVGIFYAALAQHCS